jgi:mannosyltransferase
MRILLDASIFSLQTRGGISRYTFEIASYLATQKPNEMVLGLLPGYKKNHFATFIENLNTLRFSWPVLESRYFSRKISSHEFNIVHSPYFLLPRRAPNRTNVITVHDLISLENSRPLRTKFKNQFLISAIKRSDAFIFISHETKRLFMGRFGDLWENSRTTVIYNGVGEIFRPSQSTKMLPALLDLNREYILWVGPRSGYKNFIPFLEAFVESRSKNHVLLVLVGGPEPDENEQRLLSMAEWTKLQDVSDQLLVELYSRATALIYPSSKEGFGLPILEAMSCACPVICFNFGAMGEVSAGNAIYLEGFSPDEIDRTIDIAISSSRLEIITKALIHAAAFSWKKTAESTYQFYRSLC